MRLQKILLAFTVSYHDGVMQNRKRPLMEPVKDLNALWRINNVTRNETDITQFIDSTGFRLMLSADNTYTLQGNNIPFVADDAAGTWSLDDPQYPYNIIFKPTGSTNTFSGKVATPVSHGNRSLKITFSPGCKSNAYVYTFEKVY